MKRVYINKRGPRTTQDTGLRHGLAFTGTRDGMSEPQRRQVDILLSNLRKPIGAMIHLGDAIGADAEVADLAKKARYFRCAHPSDVDSQRAFKDYNTVAKPLPPLTRNKIMVDKSKMLIAAPKGPEELRSGTWATIRYALGTIPVWIVWPSGKVDIHTPETLRAARRSVRME